MSEGLKLSCRYRKIDQATFKGETASAWISGGFEDPCWDRFLQGSPLGQFQQSTIWARAKEPGGWTPVRVVLMLGGQIVGGFQILHHLWWWGGIGYVSKGPVAPAKHPEMADYTTELLRKVCRSQRLRALVVQPPDFCEQMETRLAGSGLAFSDPVDVNGATWVFDLRRGFEAVRRQMAKQTRRNVRQAVGKGVKIREGGRQDLGVFFDLMLATCRRQGVDPNPPDMRYLFALWDAAHPFGCIRLTFADYEGKPLSGLICIAFGKTLTMWKRGWNGMERKRHPNELLTFEALKLAAQKGCDFCDYSSFDKEMGIAIQNGEPLSKEQERSRHRFITHFGGMPRFLPDGRLLFPNPFIRLAAVFFHSGIGKARQVCGARGIDRRRLFKPTGIKHHPPFAAMAPGRFFLKRSLPTEDYTGQTGNRIESDKPQTVAGAH